MQFAQIMHDAGKAECLEFAGRHAAAQADCQSGQGHHEQVVEPCGIIGCRDGELDFEWLG